MKYINFLLLSLVCAVSVHAMETQDAVNLGKQLTLAAANGNTKEVQRLIAVGADLDQQDIIGDTALMYATSHDHQVCLRSLIDAGADLNIQSKYGDTALMQACRNNHLACIQNLIHAGADLELQNVHGNTALMEAANFYCPAICECLVQAMLTRNQKAIQTSLCPFMHCLQETSYKQCPNLRDLFKATFRTLALETRHRAPIHARQQILTLHSIHEELKNHLLTKFNLA